MEELKRAYAQNLSQLANIVTGFSVAQAMVVVLALNSQNDLKKALIAHRQLAIRLVCGIQPILCIVVWWCRAKQMSLCALRPDLGNVLWWVAVFQTIVLILVGAAFIAIAKTVENETAITHK